MNDIAKILMLATFTCAWMPAGAQSILMDNVPPIPLSVSSSIAAVRINPSSGNVSVRSFTGDLSQCTGSAFASAGDKSILGGNTGLEINGSGRIQLLATPIDYLNRTVGQGRRVISLRVTQPLLCVDFAAAPVGAINPVGLKITDPNNEVGAVIYGGITSFNFLTNGTGFSSLIVNSGTQLACCTMLPAANASCFQGGNAGLGVPAGASSLTAGPSMLGALTVGRGNIATAGPGREKGSVPNLSVALFGPDAVLPGTEFVYSIVVTNTGATGIGGVRVRDWFPKSSSGLAMVFSNGSWNCAPTAGGSCGTSNGTGNVVLNNVSLSAGSSVILSVSRTLGAFAPLGSPYSVSAIAFAPPAANEVVLSDNQAMLSGIAAVPESVFATGFE